MKKKQRLKAFSLLECLIALSLSVFLLGILNMAFNTSFRVDNNTQEADKAEWEQFADLISSENLSLHFVDIQNNITFFSSPTKDKDYRIVYYNGLVKMTGSEGGYIPLLYEVSAFETFYHDNLLTIRASIHQREYNCKIVMAKKE
ncbi:competence type IV pilus minor pilin ComGF [Liquorilactobacillus oeni]|uniref:Competence protein ComGF n=1 Tax=Liquorilactobacillus oeni DSM 19972 TaxID=1423777 RepID=A0A0R1M6T0_9LACO|nr:competence type IV pilus minor pilin ComGF [Liquorilactobacillus oeni]KRL03981.1 hypothetical protein FD46_GL000148 [Liquorilactobacillus oeni DSM 19972]